MLTTELYKQNSETKSVFMNVKPTANTKMFMTYYATS